MARQSTTPVQFSRTVRPDETVLMSSGRAGLVIPCAYIPLLRGDSCSGSVGIDVNLAEMPKPLLNAVGMNAQVWFVPKPAHPKFPGHEDFMASYQNIPVKMFPSGVRDVTPFFTSVTGGGAIGLIASSALATTLGLSFQEDEPLQTDVIDAFVSVNNFRRAAHSSKLPLQPFYLEDDVASMELQPAFWPSNRFSQVVPDYEQALILGALDLDVSAGSIPVKGIGPSTNAPGSPASITWKETEGIAPTTGFGWKVETIAAGESGNTELAVEAQLLGDSSYPAIYAEMTGQAIGITLAGIDKARTTQAFAKLRTAYAGNDPTGFVNDDAIVAELMQGFSVPDDMFDRPWLLDQVRVGFGMQERFATDAANLDASVSQGRASASLSINVPVQDVGGMIVVIIEVLPERLDERMSDEFWYLNSPSQLPDALRDVQRELPVDDVLNRRLDAKHSDPEGVYGFEPMNAVWHRRFTRLGGIFKKENPGDPWTENRAAIWLPDIVDPAFNDGHYLAPQPFPHEVFADFDAPAFEFVCRHSVQIAGITQIGDVLQEDNNEYEDTEE